MLIYFLRRAPEHFEKNVQGESGMSDDANARKALYLHYRSVAAYIQMSLVKCNLPYSYHVSFLFSAMQCRHFPIERARSLPLDLRKSL